MKKLNICIAGAAALLCFNCGDSNSVNVSGTSEELNEVADKGSSSSGTPGTESSSSVKDQKNSSSSVDDQNPNSSSSGDVQTPNNGSLDAYLQQYGLETKYRFDKAVLALNKSEMVSRTPAMDGSTNATEFDGEGVRKFVQQNIGAIETLFPKAAEKYADLIEATKNGTNECSLYSFNLYGNKKYAGHVLEYVSPDTMKVVDIEAKNCEDNTSNQIVRFLFSYCGDVSKEPVVERTTAKSDIAKDKCPASKTDDEWVNVIDSKDVVTSSSSETPNSSSSKEIANCRHISDNEALKQGANCNSDTDFDIVTDCATGDEYRCALNYWTLVDICAPGGDCNGDGIPDGIYRPDLEPCDTDTLLYFYERHYQCVEGKWEYLPPPDSSDTRDQARNATLSPRQGMAVTPRVVMARNEDGTISIRDDGYNASNNFVIEAVYTEISGDTIVVDVIYPDGAKLSSFQIGALTFTVSKVYTNVKYLRYKDDDRVKEIQEVDELLPCASSSTCQECGEGLDC